MTTGLDIYRLAGRLDDAVMRLWIRRSFMSWGAGSVVQRPLRVWGESAISIGAGVFIGRGSWLQALDSRHASGPRITVGDGVRAAGLLTISATASVSVEEDVLMARNVYIADHRHAFGDPTLPVREQGLEGIDPVTICRGAWLGQNVVIMPGVTVGAGTVIGSNSVVTRSVPGRVVAAGSPARVVRELRDPPV